MKQKIFICIISYLMTNSCLLSASDTFTLRTPIGLSAAIYGSIDFYKSSRNYTKDVKRTYKENLREAARKKIEISLLTRKQFKKIARNAAHSHKTEALLSAVIALVGTGITFTKS